MFIPNKKQYNELTSAEKMLVGYIYDLYFQWLKDCHIPNTPTYLKNSFFTDFLSKIKIEDDLKYYADYLYLDEYRDEHLIENEEHRFIVPKSAITLTNEAFADEMNKFHKKIKAQQKTFFQKLLSK